MKHMPKEILDRLCFKQRQKYNQDELYPPVIKIEYESVPCEDCGLGCKNRVVQYHHRKLPVENWRTYCMECKLNKNPETGVFELTTGELQRYWIAKTAKKKTTKDK